MAGHWGAELQMVTFRALVHWKAVELGLDCPHKVGEL